MSRLPDRLVVAVCALCASLAGCGAERAGVAAPEPGSRQPTVRKEFRSAGLELALPRQSIVEDRRRPGVFKALLGQATLSAFAYRRREPLPRGAAELRAAGRRLVREVRRRDRRFRVIRTRMVRMGGARGIELLGEQTLSRTLLRTRSLHLFRGQVEYVLEMLAPPAVFEAAERGFFGPAARSLKLSGRLSRR